MDIISSNSNSLNPNLTAMNIMFSINEADVIPTADSGDFFSFHTGTFAEYTAAKASNRLVPDDIYYTTDTKQVFLGYSEYCRPFITVTNFPATGIVPDTLYLNTVTGEIQYHDGALWHSLVPKVHESVDFNSTANDSDIPSIGAIKAAVKADNESLQGEDTATVSTTAADRSISMELKVATHDGAVTVTTANGLKIELADATVDAKGIVQLASTSEALAGTDTSKVITPEVLQYAINKNIAGAVTYLGILPESIPTAQKGDMYRIDVNRKIAKVKLHAGDMIIFNEDYDSSSTITASQFTVLCSSDEDNMKLDATQEVISKTINAEANTISNLATGNMTTDAISTAIPSENPVDTKFATEKAAAEAIETAKSSLTLTSSNSIELVNNALNVKLSQQANNALQATENGLELQYHVKAIANTESVTLTNTDGTLTANVKLADQENVKLETTEHGLCADVFWEEL